MKTIRLLIVVGFVLGLGSPSWARMPRSREFCGTLLTVLVSDRTIVVDGGNGRRVSAVWTKRTTFVHDGNHVERPNLKSGERVCVYYHTPLFGPKYMTKVSW